MADNDPTQTAIPDGLIDLGAGKPSLDLLPHSLLQHSVAEFLAAGDPRPLQYGKERGDPELRKALAEQLAAAYGGALDPDGLMITHGSSGALDLLCTLFTRSGDIVYVEEPTYFMALTTFRDHGLQLLPLPVDDDGLQVDVLENELRLAALRRELPKLLYTIPIFQNPSGRSLSTERRLRLTELARRYGFLVIADEVYHLLGDPEDMNGRSVPAMFTYAQKDEVISLGSFSKILSPGLRLGWIYADPQASNHMERLVRSGLLDSGGGLAPFTSAMVRGLVADGSLFQNIERLRRVFAVRRQALHHALQTHLPQAEWRCPDGGYFFWVRLPGGLDAEALLPVAREAGVAYRPGARFSSRGESGDFVRLGFSYYDEEKLDIGIRRLADVVRSALG